MVRETDDSAGNRQLFLKWFLFTLLGWLAVVALSSLISRSSVLGQPLQNYVVANLLSGCLLGLIYWRGLRQFFLVSPLRWGVGTAVGFLVGGTGWLWAQLLDLYVVNAAPGTVILEWDPLIGGALLGLGLGLGQSWAWQLPSQLALSWIVAHLAAWSLGLFLADFTLYLFGIVLLPGTGWFFFHNMLQGGISGCITGLGLLLIAADVP